MCVCASRSVCPFCALPALAMAMAADTQDTYELRASSSARVHTMSTMRSRLRAIYIYAAYIYIHMSVHMGVVCVCTCVCECIIEYQFSVCARTRAATATAASEGSQSFINVGGTRPVGLLFVDLAAKTGGAGVWRCVCVCVV